ncbi:MAG: cation:proton antiporter, partial [Gemmatimonas sp.]
PVPRRVIVILEGGSLVNGASALVLYRSAVAAAVTGVFSWGESIVRFFIDAGIGVLIGLGVAWLIVKALRWTKDSLAETMLTICGPYVAWILAESLHRSAVLACVAGGLYLRQHLSLATAPLSRLQNLMTWDLLIFVLNAMIFLLLGYEFTTLLREVPNGQLSTIITAGVIISAVVIVVRLVWVPISQLSPRLVSEQTRRNTPKPSNKALFLVAWTSMRGIVSLATALALPTVLASGARFPYRTEIILITMVVIMMTLVVQGLTLEPIIRKFNFSPEHTHHDEERLARREALRRSAETLEDLSREPWVDPMDVEALRAELRERMRMHESGGGTYSRRRLRVNMINAERRMLVRLRNEGAISDEVLRELEQELDLEAVRVGAGSARPTM